MFEDKGFILMDVNGVCCIVWLVISIIDLLIELMFLGGLVVGDYLELCGMLEGLVVSLVVICVNDIDC